MVIGLGGELPPGISAGYSDVGDDLFGPAGGISDRAERGQQRTQQRMDVRKITGHIDAGPRNARGSSINFARVDEPGPVAP